MAHPGTTTVPGRIGDYDIQCQLAAGAMGVVYKAYDVNLQRTVALKFLNGYAGIPSPAHESVLREARAASALDHKNIASIHSVENTDDGRLFIVMAFYDGESLAARMQSSPLSPGEALDIIRQVAQGLAHAHSHGIVHRDIKPSNIMLTADGEPKIVDFGLARHVGADVSTQSLSLAGTLPYMSPEQLSGKPLDLRTDIWSLGVMMYELLTGRLPFEGDSAASTVAAILHSTPREMDDLSPELQFIISRALAKNPDKRYQSCAELLHDLSALESSATIAALGPEERAFERRVHLASFSRAFKSLFVGHPVRGALLLVMLFVATTINTARPFQGDSPRNAIRTSNVAYDSYLSGLQKLERYDKRANLDAAINLFTASTTTDPRFALGYVGLCEAYYDKYRLDRDRQWLDRASADCKRAAELNDRLPAVHVALGRIHQGIGQHDLALLDFQRALELDARNSAALIWIGDVYQSLGRDREAEDSIKNGIALRPDNWDGYYRLAFFYFNARQYALAAGQYRRVIQMVPDHAGAHANLGTMLLHLRRPAEAEAEYKRAIDIDPHSYAAYSALGAVYYGQKRYSECVAMNLRAIRENRNDYRIWGNLAEAYEWLGEKKKAAETYEQQRLILEENIKLRTDDAGMQSDLGTIYARTNLRDQSLPHLEAAIALSPNDPHVLEDVAEAYEYLGEPQQAVHYLIEAMQKGTTLDELRQNPGLQRLLSDAGPRQALAASQTSTAPATH